MGPAHLREQWSHVYIPIQRRCGICMTACEPAALHPRCPLLCQRQLALLGQAAGLAYRGVGGQDLGLQTHRGKVWMGSELKGAVPEVLLGRGLEHGAAVPGHQKAAVSLDRPACQTLTHWTGWLSCGMHASMPHQTDVECSVTAVRRSSSAPIAPDRVQMTALGAHTTEAPTTHWSQTKCRLAGPMSLYPTLLHNHTRLAAVSMFRDRSSRRMQAVADPGSRVPACAAAKAPITLCASVHSACTQSRSEAAEASS